MNAHPSPDIMDQREVSLFDLLRFGRRNRLVLGVGVLLGVVVGLGSSLLARSQYEATVVMTLTQATEGTGSFGGTLGQLGGLAALAGINISTSDRKHEFLEVLRSRAFAEGFLAREQLFPIIASEARGFVSRFQDGELSRADVIERFREAIMRVEEDRRSGIIRLTVRWHDRERAATWANSLVEAVNHVLRERALQDSQRLVEYLDDQVKSAASMAVQQALYAVLEKELKTAAIARVREDYAFRILDPAVSPEEHDTVSPNVAFRVFTGCIVGLLLGAMVARLRERRS